MEIKRPEWGENISFITEFKDPKCEPHFQEGVDVDFTNGEEGVWIDLPYPAPFVGTWMVKYNGKRYGCTAASRVDDPKRIKVPKN